VPTALFAQALALATAAGISTYGTVALLGAAAHFGFIDALPSGLAPIANPWIFGLAAALYALEFAATLIPGVASLWETVHAAIRPVAGAAIAAATVSHADPRIALAATLLGGTLALGTNVTKLGARIAIDTSPEPFTNGAANIAELGLFGALAIGAMQHPYIALTLGLAVVIVTGLLVRAAYRAIRGTLRRLRPGRASGPLRSS